MVRLTAKKKKHYAILSLCERNPLVIGGFPSQRDSYAVIRFHVNMSSRTTNCWCHRHSTPQTHEKYAPYIAREGQVWVTLVSLQSHQNIVRLSPCYIGLYLTQCIKVNTRESQRHQAINSRFTDFASWGKYLFSMLVYKKLSIFYGHISYDRPHGSTVSDMRDGFCLGFKADKYFACIYFIHMAL